MFSRTVIAGAVIAVIVLSVGAFRVPGWILVAFVVVTTVLSFGANAKRMRMERRFVRALWNVLTRR